MNKGLSNYNVLGTNAVVSVNVVKTGKTGDNLTWMKKHPCFTCTSLSHTMNDCGQKQIIGCSAVGWNRQHNPETHKIVVNFKEAQKTRRANKNKNNADNNSSNIRAVKTTTDKGDSTVMPKTTNKLLEQINAISTYISRIANKQN